MESVKAVGKKRKTIKSRAETISQLRENIISNDSDNILSNF